MGKVSGMDSRLKKLIAGAAVILLLGGASAAALTATGQSHRPSARAARPAHAFARLGGGRDLGTAASYLGMSSAQLQSELESGRTLAAIASATSGKSESGLIDVIVAAKKEMLAAARAAGSITAERENAMAASLHKRIGKLVTRS